ncbi:MAG: hypothetical protein QOG62_982 [Thermoleophilaceae bacterium]|jgi:hypothetical protein|nr:hypothetical protein [Thermoleophilaceae bacterium]
MGKRSRKRISDADISPAGSARAERDAARARRAAQTPAAAPSRPGPRRGGVRPPAPWGKFPLTELVVLLAIVLLVLAFFVFKLETPRGRVAFVAGLTLGFLAGLETAVRDHFSGYRSHTTLLAAACSVAAMVAVSLLINFVIHATGLLVLSAVLLVGAVVFAVVFPSFRRIFSTRSGGRSFR